MKNDEDNCSEVILIGSFGLLVFWPEICGQKRSTPQGRSRGIASLKHLT